MIYPIPSYLFKWLIFPKLLVAYMNTVIPFLLTYIFQKYCSNYTINIYIVFKFFIPRAFQKYNICRMYGDRSCICVFLYLCICVFTSLDTHNYLFWGLVLSRNHCWQILILYIRVYMPSGDCTLLRSRGGGGGAIFLKVHLPASRWGCQGLLQQQL